MFSCGHFSNQLLPLVYAFIFTHTTSIYNLYCYDMVVIKVSMHNLVCFDDLGRGEERDGFSPVSLASFFPFTFFSFPTQTSFSSSPNYTNNMYLLHVSCCRVNK